MSKLTIARTDAAMPSGTALDGVRSFLFGVLDGFGQDDKKAWRRFWKRVTQAEPGEMFNVEVVSPRSGKFHRFHMAMEQSLFDSQDRFDDFEMLRSWLKIGSGWVKWVPGAKGGIVPLPKSISYAKADEDEFQQYHAGVVRFLRGGHAAKYLWPHLDQLARDEMMECILQVFEQ
ncbi:MAG: hypothetical protein A2V79_05445 [Betaproteobacteria bacterium RBG_16_56_24]|nr:MAG: hypothetical protein A2V79_05445 [Betaproteobacteria bacterium RBG_16_56_24]